MQSYGKVLVLAVLFAVGCGGGGSDGDAGPDGGTDAGQDGGQDAGGDAGCTPITCAETAGCGTYANGCGANIACTQTCECTESNFETACAQKPCQTRTGCVSGLCQYAAVTCNAQTCAPVACTGPGCEGVCTTDTCENGLYSCGGNVCANTTDYCDPRPTVLGGAVTYQNVCVGPPQDGCGTCNLGVRACDSGSDRYTCNDVPVPVADSGGTVECDSTVLASTFLYVDTNYTGGSNDGGKAKPFTTYAAALAAAQARNSRGIVIAGSPVFTTPLVVGDGISVYGGYGPSPTFYPNRALRPSWEIPSSAIDTASNQLVGARAQGVANGAVLFHLSISTADVSANDGLNGASNIALWVKDSPGLKVVDTNLHAGTGGAGVDGAPGATPTPAMTGGNASGRVNGAAPGACPMTCTLTTPVVGQGTNVCGYGGIFNKTNSTGTTIFPPTAAPGNGGNPGGTVGGGSAGTTAYNNSNCGITNTTTAGGIGTAGTPGQAGFEGTAGLDGTLQASGLFVPAPGTSGGTGSPGTWGGGGGGGGSYYDGCESHDGVSGGGGGGPGCGGDYGRRGGGGGASIAVAVVNSTGFAISGGTVTTSAAGRGGNGGAGGTGGSPGLGETTGLCPTNTSSKAKCGGPGGNGGAGGRGGHAGGGAGGDSVGIYCVGSSVTQSTSYTVGSAGSGGSAAGGLNGGNGSSGNTLGCP